MSYEPETRKCAGCEKPYHHTEKAWVFLDPKYLLCFPCWLEQDDPQEDGITPDQWRAGVRPGDGPQNDNHIRYEDGSGFQERENAYRHMTEGRPY